MAWLQAAPKPPEGSRRAALAAGKRQPTRFERMKKAGGVPPMPPNPLPHIINRWIEIGLSEPGTNGPKPLTWREIEAWQRSVGVTLDPWEARLIRQLSVAYVAEARIAEDETCPPPWRAPVTQSEVETEVPRLKMVLG